MTLDLDSRAALVKKDKDKLETNLCGYGKLLAGF